MRTFAIHSESGIELKETDELKPLFDTFKSFYSASGELPSVTGQLVTEMQKNYDACVLFEQWSIVVILIMCCFIKKRNIG